MALITDVGIDLDGVLYDFVGAFKTFCEPRVSRDLPDATKWDFYHEWGLTDEIFDSWLYEATVKNNIFEKNDPIKNAVEGWQALKDMGLTIHILTHRFHPAHEQTCRWLNRHGFITNNLHFGTNKKILRNLATGDSAAVDDHFNYYQDYQKIGVKAFMLTQPWNVNHEGRRVSDLLEFAKYVDVYNEYQRIYKSDKKDSDYSDFFKGISETKHFMTNLGTDQKLPHVNPSTKTVHVTNNLYTKKG